MTLTETGTDSGTYTFDMITVNDKHYEVERDSNDLVLFEKDSDNSLVIVDGAYDLETKCRNENFEYQNDCLAGYAEVYTVDVDDYVYNNREQFAIDNFHKAIPNL